MFNYNLAGKQVILVLEEDFVEKMKFAGIEGSPVVARVHKMEDGGLWLKSETFPACPTGVPQLYKAAGEKWCRAHIFIPAGAIDSVVVFPAAVADIEKDPNLFSIGFKAGTQKAKKGK